MAWVEWDDRLRVRGFEDRVLWALREVPGFGDLDFGGGW